MYEKFLENYIDNLYNYQNQTSFVEQQKLFTKKEYYVFLKPVVELLKKYKDHTIEELRNLLYQQSNIEEYVKDFFDKKAMAPGVVMRYGTLKYSETIVFGNKVEKTKEEDHFVPEVKKMEENTIFDLASITKIFTSFSILLLEQRGLLSLKDEIQKYDDRFKNLKGVTIFDLLTFKVPLKTRKRIDEALSREEAEQLLFSIQTDPSGNPYKPYTDMGAMVLKYVIEKASGMKYDAFLKENIFLPFHMEDSYVLVPKRKLDRVASTNFDFKYYNEDSFSITNNEREAVYDPKAQKMGQMEGILSGHAGLFSTARDMSNFAKNLINETIFSKEVLEKFSKNRTGRVYVENEKIKYVQYFGMLCYSKYPNLCGTEVEHALSGKTFASAGWTGTYFTVDPLNDIYLFLGSNRSHNRVTSIDPINQNKISVEENGRKTIVLPNKERKIITTGFAFDRNSAVVSPALKLTIQYKMLEDFYEQCFKEVKKEEKIKIL